MKLEFGILWIEDDPDPGMQEAVRDSVESSGFRAHVDMAKKRDEIFGFSQEQEKYHIYDLVLIDWNLGDFDGDEIIKEIREMFLFTPILFYSGKATTTALRTMISEREIDGVYCAERAQLAEQTERLIETFSKPLNQLSGMRGLGAQVVAEIDELYQQMILTLIGDDKDKESKAIEHLKAEIENQFSKSSNSLEKFSDISSFLEAPLTDSMKLFKLFRHLLKDYIKSCGENKKIAKVTDLNYRIKDYGKDILGVRNTLSHALEEKTNDGWVITDRKGNKITSVNFINYRSEFSRYLENLRKLRELLK